MGVASAIVCDDGGDDGGGRLAPVVARMKYLSPAVALSRACAQKTDPRQTPTSGRRYSFSRLKTPPKLLVLDLPGSKECVVVKAPWRVESSVYTANHRGEAVLCVLCVATRMEIIYYCRRSRSNSRGTEGRYNPNLTIRIIVVPAFRQVPMFRP